MRSFETSKLQIVVSFASNAGYPTHASQCHAQIHIHISHEVSTQEPKAISPHRTITQNPPRDHTAQHHHPNQKHGPNNPKRENRQPTLARCILLQPGQRIDGGALELQVVSMPEDVEVAVAVDISRGPEELDGGLDDAGDVEDEEDEGADHHHAREEAALVDEAEHDEDEDDGQAADCDAVGHDPIQIG